MKLSYEYSHNLMGKFGSFYAILTTIGKHGVVYTTREEDIDRSIRLGPNSQLFDAAYDNQKVGIVRNWQS